MTYKVWFWCLFYVLPLRPEVLVIKKKKMNSNVKLQKLVPPINSKWFEDKDRETVLFVDRPAILAQTVV